MIQLKNLEDELHTIADLQSITEAFEQSAASALRMTRGRIVAGRLFAEETWHLYRVLRSFIPRAATVQDKTLVVVVTVNEGMTGGLLNRIVSEGLRVGDEQKADILITGKKGRSRLASNYRKSVHYFALPTEVKYEQLDPVKVILAKYARVYVVFPRYYSSGDQRIESLCLSDMGKEVSNKKMPAQRFRVEPNPQAVIDYFNKEIMGIMVYACFAEAQLAYNAAQMMAMQRAKESADKYFRSTTNKYRRARRERVDTKLREVLQSRLLHR